MSRDIRFICIHCAATPTGKPFTVNDIDSWHLERGFQRKDEFRERFNPHLFAIGYQYVIYLDGSTHTGRHEQETPAAVLGFNTVSINICLIGEGKYTLPQWDALRTLVLALKDKYSDAQVAGHNLPLFKSGKTCPNFSVDEWLVGDCEPLEDHIS